MANKKNQWKLFDDNTFFRLLVWCNKKIILLIMTLLLAACQEPPYISKNSALPYPFGQMYGYSNQALPGGIVKVNFDAGPYTPIKYVTDFTIRRGAELAKEQNMPYFAMYESLSNISKNKKTKMPIISAMTTDDQWRHPSDNSAYAYFVFHEEKEPGDFSTAAILRQYQTKR